MRLRYYAIACNIPFKRLADRHIQSRSLGGQTLAEYALILAFISVVAISTLLALGGQVSTVFTTVSHQMTAATEGGATTPSHNH